MIAYATYIFHRNPIVIRYIFANFYIYIYIFFRFYYAILCIRIQTEWAFVCLIFNVASHIKTKSVLVYDILSLRYCTWRKKKKLKNYEKFGQTTKVSTFDLIDKIYMNNAKNDRIFRKFRRVQNFRVFTVIMNGITTNKINFHRSNRYCVNVFVRFPRHLQKLQEKSKTNHDRVSL